MLTRNLKEEFPHKQKVLLKKPSGGRQDFWMIFMPLELVVCNRPIIVLPAGIFSAERKKICCRRSALFFFDQSLVSDYNLIPITRTLVSNIGISVVINQCFILWKSTMLGCIMLKILAILDQYYMV